MAGTSSDPFHCIDPCIDRVRSGDRCPGKMNPVDVYKAI